MKKNLFQAAGPQPAEMGEDPNEEANDQYAEGTPGDESEDVTEEGGAEGGEQGGEQGGEEGGDADPDSNPAYQKALLLAKKKLYADNAGQGLMRALQSASDIGTALGQQTVMILQMLDQMTEEQVPDELYIMLGIELMGEVAEIAEAGGIKVQPRDVATGVKTLITDVVKDMGGDMSQVQAAMDQFPPDRVASIMGEG